MSTRMRMVRELRIWFGVLGVLVMFSMSQRMQSQTENWQSYNYPSEGFSASFPSTPTLKSQNVPTEKGSFELRAYLAEVGQSALFVGICDYGNAIQDRTPDQVLEGAKQGAAENVKAHITTQQKINLGIYPGISFEADNDTMHFTARVYLVGTTLYQTLTASPLKDPYAGSRRFMDSFQLIPRTVK